MTELLIVSFSLTATEDCTQFKADETPSPTPELPLSFFFMILDQIVSFPRKPSLQGPVKTQASCGRLNQKCHSCRYQLTVAKNFLPLTPHRLLRLLSINLFLDGILTYM